MSVVNKSHWAILLFVFFSSVSCQFTSQKKLAVNDTNSEVDLAFYHPTIIKHAKGFEIKILDSGLKELRVLDPWNKGKVFQKYYLKNRGEELKDSVPTDGLLVEVPIRSIAALSSTQIGILKFLNVQ